MRNIFCWVAMAKPFFVAIATCDTPAGKENTVKHKQEKKSHMSEIILKLDTSLGRHVVEKFFSIFSSSGSYFYEILLAHISMKLF